MVGQPPAGRPGETPGHPSPHPEGPDWFDRVLAGGFLLGVGSIIALFVLEYLGVGWAVSSLSGLRQWAHAVNDWVVDTVTSP